MSLQIIQVANDLLSKLGIEGSDPTLAPALAQQDVIVAINAALQQLQAAGEDYFTRTRITQNIQAGTSIYPLALGTQAVLGNMRLNDVKPLRAIASRGELDQYDRIFLGSSTYGQATGIPSAYWVQNQVSGSPQSDIDQISIYLAPVPNSNGNITFDAIAGAPSYTVANIGSTALLPVAHEYTESIFLPIARMLVTRSSQFSRPDLLEQLTADAEVAMQRLGATGGFPNVQPRNPGREVVDNQ
jgi:hypothetical protein